jgi:CBS domain-containing protein
MKRVRDVMTGNPVTSTPEISVKSVANLMLDTNCGEILICDEGKVIGVITDRDIVCRAVARGLDLDQTSAGEIMTKHPFLAHEDDWLRHATALMERESLRRLPVVDKEGSIVGILSQVDVAARASHRRAGTMLAFQHPDATRY